MACSSGSKTTPAASTPSRQRSFAGSRLSTCLSSLLFSAPCLSRLQSFDVSRCSLIEHFLQRTPVVQTAADLRHQLFGHIDGKIGARWRGRRAPSSGVAHSTDKLGSSRGCTGLRRKL